MTPATPKNLAHSVRDRLLRLAKARGEDFNFVLVRFSLERLLYRLSRSPHGGEFILKGAMLFTVWSRHPHRATKDLDLLGSGASSIDRLADVFREICAAAVEDDGVVFDPHSVKARRIKEHAEYEGVRVTLEGTLGSARLALQIDVGFGDATVPPPSTIEFPTLLPFPAPMILAYARETVVAEKLHAMVDLGMANTRMKDFFDLWFLSREFEFEGASLVAAIRSTFERRQTPIPEALPVALTDAFTQDGAKAKQWAAFLSRSGANQALLSLPDVALQIGTFLKPAIGAARRGDTFARAWLAGAWLQDGYRLLFVRRVPSAEVVLGRAYVIHARNGGVGVAVDEDGRRGYRLHREKFGSHYLFVEYDWAEGPPYGTAIPLQAIDEAAPVDEVTLLAWLAKQEAAHRDLIDDAWKTILGAGAGADPEQGS